MSISCGQVQNNTLWKPWRRLPGPQHRLCVDLRSNYHVIFKFFDCHYKSKPRGSRHTKLNFTHLIRLVITTKTTEAQSTDNPDYSSGPRKRLWVPLAPSPLITPVSSHHSHIRVLSSSRHVNTPPSSSSSLIFLLQHYDLNSCTNKKILT